MCCAGATAAAESYNFTDDKLILHFRMDGALKDALWVVYKYLLINTDGDHKDVDDASLDIIGYFDADENEGFTGSDEVNLFLAGRGASGVVGGTVRVIVRGGCDDDDHAVVPSNPGSSSLN